jgi:hypothetical protein
VTHAASTRLFASRARRRRWRAAGARIQELIYPVSFYRIKSRT